MKKRKEMFVKKLAVAREITGRNTHLDSHEFNDMINEANKAVSKIVAKYKKNTSKL